MRQDMTTRHDDKPGAHSRKIHDDLDIALAMLERLAPTLERDPACDQPREPALLRGYERIGRHLIVPAVGVDGADHGVVGEHHGAVETTDVEVEYLSRLADTRQTDDP